MLWVPCVRIDLPVDPTHEHIHAMAHALDAIVSEIEQTEIARASLAFSSAALGCFVREGFGAVLQRVALLADKGSVELLGTAAHGALLPLLPVSEIERQLQLNDAENRRWFGDAYRPACLWPPQLAVSQKVAEVAAALDYTSMLVDEAAMRVWPDQWPSNRVDAMEGLPGFFLLPCSRHGSSAFAKGLIRTHADLRKLAGESSGFPQRRIAIITAMDLREGTAPEVSLRAQLDTAPTARIEELFKVLPLDRATSLLPCSGRSTADEIVSGLPFAAWFTPDDDRQRLKWHLMRKLVDALERLASRGYSSEPSVVTLRETVDVCWRESWWRNLVEGQTDPLRRILHAVEELGPLLEPEAREEILGTCVALQRPGTAVDGERQEGEAPTMSS